MSRRAERAATDAEQAAVLFAALGDPTRLRIVARLGAEGPLSMVALSDGAPVTRQAITKHVRALESAGFVHGVRKAGQRPQRWALAPRKLDEARRYLKEIAQQWDDALQRLKDFVEP